MFSYIQNLTAFSTKCPETKQLEIGVSFISQITRLIAFGVLESSIVFMWHYLCTINTVYRYWNCFECVKLGVEKSFVEWILQLFCTVNYYEWAWFLHDSKYRVQQYSYCNLVQFELHVLMTKLNRSTLFLTYYLDGRFNKFVIVYSE